MAEFVFAFDADAASYKKPVRHQILLLCIDSMGLKSDEKLFSGKLFVQKGPLPGGTTIRLGRGLN